MGGYAWVTLATNDSYSLGALVLANSLRQLGTAHQLAVLVTPGVTSAMREKLGAVFDVVREVNILDSKDEANLRLLKRPELGITFTKLHSWRLTQFDKCVFLDADTLVLENADELFEREELSAAPDVGWPDCFNSGVFVYRPSEATYEKLVQFALDRGSFDGGDQGLLNLFFSDWAHKDISKHLPFIYNMCSTACYSYLPAFKQFGGNVKIVHFIGPAKPWLQYFDTESRQVHPTPDLQHLQGVLQRWWDIFFALIQPQLSTEMARSQSPAVHYHLPPPPDTRSYHSQYYDSEYFNEVAHTDYTKVWDPWEHYEPNTEFAESEHANVCNSNYSNNNVQSGAEIVAVTREPFESQNTKAHHVQPRRSPSPAPQIKLFKTIESHQVTSEIHSAPVINQEYVHTKPVHVSVESAHFPIDPFHVPVESVHVPVESVRVPVESVHVPVESVHVPVESSAHIPPNTNTQAPVNPNPVPIPDSYRSSPALPNEFEPTCTVANECTKHDDTGPISQKDAGLAAAFSQLKLGEPRSPGQLALEDNLRRQGWEVGNIDYLGKDSFDNIWKKIQQTIDSAPPQPPSKPRESSPPTSAPAPVGQDDEARKAKQKSPPKEQAPQETPSTTPATGDAPATPNAEVVAAVPATETPKAEPVEAPKPAVEIPKAETEPPKIEPAPIPEAPKTAAVEAPKVEAVEAPKPAPEAVQPVPLPEAPKTDVESPKVEAESPKPEPVEVPTSAAIPESPAQPAPVLETPKTEVAQVEPETSKTEPVTAVAPAPVPESLKEEPTQLTAAEAPKVEGEGTKPAETAAPTLESPKPESVPESPKTEAPKPAPESPKTEAPKPAPESPKTEAPKLAPESPKTEAPTPVPESPKAEAPKTAPESPKTEAPTPVPESPKAEVPTPVPESPKAEAPKAAPESPKTEAPKPAPESPKAEAPKPAPEAPKTEVPKPAPEGPKTEVPKPAPESPKTETAKPTPVPESPKTEASKPEAQASKAEATKEVSKPKEESKIPQPKGAAEAAPKASPASPTSGEPPSPTPPPRKASGGAKKGPKGKK